jgi:hypothetical protein
LSAEKLNAGRTKEIRAGALAQIPRARYTILMLKIRLTENAAPPHGRGCYPAARKAPWGSLQSKLQAENPPWKADFQPLTAHDYTLLKRRRVKSPIGNNPFSFPNKQFSQKYTAFSFQNGSFSFQNAAFSLDNAVFSFQNAAFSLANAVFSFQNGSFSLENNAFSFQNKSFSLDNAEFSLAHSAFSCLNTAFLKDKTIIAYGPAVRRRLLA